MMPSCKEVSRRVAEGTMEDLSIGGRLMVRIHLLMCKHCRLYTAQIESIGRAARVYSAAVVGRFEGIERLEQRIIDTIRK